MPSTKYRLRNNLLEILGEYSAKEILERIASGKYTGEEDVALPPYEDWQKLAAHSEFYDAFLKRLFAGEYHLPAGEDSLPKESLRPITPPLEHGKTRQSQAGPDSSSSASDNTGQLQPHAGGNTIHQSEIDELFGETTPGKTDILVVEQAQLQEGMEPVLSKPLEGVSEGGSSSGESLRLKPRDIFSSETLRKLFNLRSRKTWAGVAVLLLLVYLLRSAPFNPDVTVGGGAASLALSSAPADERAATLSAEAAALLLQDTLLFYQGAYDVLREALEVDPANAKLLEQLATASARLATDKKKAEERRPEIEQSVRSARASDPQAAELYRAEAILALALGKLEEAKAFALKSAESDPVAAENLLLIGELHYHGGNPGEARTALQEAVRADPNRVRSRYYLALVALGQGDLAVAQTQGLEALKLNPLHPKTYSLLAEIASRQNQFTEARGLYETCGRLARFSTPDVAGHAYFRLGELHELGGNPAGAHTSYQLAYYYLKGNDSSVKAKVKGLDISDGTLKHLAKQAEYQTDYFQEQGTGLLTLGKTEEAVRFFQAAQLLNPMDGLALIQLGEVMEKTATSYEDFRRVMSYYQRAIDRDPKEVMGYIKLGSLESEQYNFDHAHKLLEKALALAPESEKPYVALGKHYYKRQDYNEALNLFLRAAKINPSDSDILYYAGKLRLVYKKDGARDAARFFSQSYTYDPHNYDALSEWLKLKVVNYEKNFAVKFTNGLLAAEPKNPQLYWVMGEIYGENKEYRRAIAFYHKSLDIDNRQSKVRMSLAKALESVGELDKAVAEFRLASLLDRRNSEGFYRAADLLFQMKNYQQAEEVLRFLVSVTPNYPGVQRYLSKIHQLRDQKDQAIESMQQEVANNPQNLKFVLELAELFIEYEKLDRAIVELKKITALPAMSQAPEYRSEKIRAYLLLSRCYRGRNQLESAEGATRLALSLDPSDPELHRELGYVYYALQRDKEGVKEFEYYLERNPAARDGMTIRGLIKRMMIEE